MKMGRIPGILALLMVGGFFLAMAGLFFVEIPEGSKEMLDQMLTALGIMLSAASGYHFKAGPKKDDPPES